MSAFTDKSHNNDDVNGCRLWDPTTHKIIMEKDGVFDESPLIKDERFKA
jgi:hypothetical protein